MAGNKTTTVSAVEMEDGVRLHVKILGDDSPKSKSNPLLIALHGAPGLSTHAEPEATFSHLSSVFRVLVFDARGSGESDLTGPYTHDRWIKDIENLRVWAGAEKFLLTGASYGGFVALDYAVRHGDKLLGLVLIDTWANGVLGPMNVVANILTSNKLTVDVARQVRVWSGTLRDDKDYAEAIQELLPFYDPPEDVVPAAELPKETGFRSLEFKFHSATQNAAFGYNMPRFDVRDQLKDIKAPTLVIVGRYDQVTPVSCSQEIAKGIASARLEIFERSGHSPSSDEPEKFQEVLLDFLKKEVL